VALGDSEHLTEKAKEILSPVYQQYFLRQSFCNPIGLKVNFIAAFDPGIVGVG